MCRRMSESLAVRLRRETAAQCMPSVPNDVVLTVRWRRVTESGASTTTLRVWDGERLIVSSSGLKGRGAGNTEFCDKNSVIARVFGLGVAPAAVAALGDDYLASKRRGVVSRALMVRREDAEPLLSESPGIRLAGVRKDGDHVPARWRHVVAILRGCAR